MHGVLRKTMQRVMSYISGCSSFFLQLCQRELLLTSMGQENDEYNVSYLAVVVVIILTNLEE